MRIKSEYVGEWRVTEMSEWDRDFIDLVAPGHLTIKADGRGTFAFGAIEAELDCRDDKAGHDVRLSFSFAGWDEGDEVSGRGWAKANDNMMEGWFALHQGEDSTFKAEKQKKTR